MDQGVTVSSRPSSPISILQVHTKDAALFNRIKQRFAADIAAGLIIERVDDDCCGPVRATERVHPTEAPERVHPTEAAERVHPTEAPKKEALEKVHSSNAPERVHSSNAPERVHSSNAPERVHPTEATERVHQRMEAFLHDLKRGESQLGALKQKHKEGLPYLILPCREPEKKDMEEILYLTPDSNRICARADVVLIGRFRERGEMGVFQAGHTLTQWGVSHKRVLQGVHALPSDLRLMFKKAVRGLSICSTETVHVVCAFLHHHFHFDYVEELRMGADDNHYFIGLTRLRLVD